MTSLFSYKYKRKLDKKLIDYVYDKINHIPYIAYIVIFFHAMFFISLLTVVCICNKNTLYFKLYFGLLIFMILINKYFDACPITRLERKLLKNNNWYGFPYNFFFDLFNIKISKFRVAVVFWSISLLLLFICFYKIYI